MAKKLKEVQEITTPRDGEALEEIVSLDDAEYVVLRNAAEAINALRAFAYCEECGGKRR